MSITNQRNLSARRFRAVAIALSIAGLRRRGNVVFERPPTSAGRNPGLLLGRRQGDLASR